MTRLMHYIIFAGLMLAVYLLAMPAKAATVWVPQDGIYQKQKSASGKVRYVLLKEVKLVPLAAEVVQDGYKQVPIDTVINEGMIVPLECEAKFYCDTTFGVIFDLTKNTALSCPKAFIKKNEALLFDASISIDNAVTCPR